MLLLMMYAMWESITIAEMFTILVEFYGDQLFSWRSNVARGISKLSLFVYNLL